MFYLVGIQETVFQVTLREVLQGAGGWVPYSEPTSNVLCHLFCFLNCDYVFSFQVEHLLTKTPVEHFSLECPVCVLP